MYRSRGDPVIDLIKGKHPGVVHRTTLDIERHPILHRRAEYWIFQRHQNRNADSYRNFSLFSPNGREYHAKYMLSNHKYKLLNSRTEVIMPPWYNPYIIYPISQPSYNGVEQKVTYCYFKNGKQHVDNTNKNWYMPIKTKWTLPEGLSVMYPDEIGLEYIMEILTDPRVDPKVTFYSYCIEFQTTEQTEIIIIKYNDCDSIHNVVHF